MRNDSVRSIQTRLFLLLLRAFAIVVALILVIIFGLTTYLLSTPARFNSPDRMPLVSSLRAYYMGHGSWNGVRIIIPVGEGRDWDNAMLVGLDGRVLLDRGSPASPLVGSMYVPSGDNRIVPLQVNGATIGNLVLTDTYVPRQVNSTLGLLAPVGFLSVFPAILTLVIGIFLVRRMVNPLAQVIAAAGSVAHGDFSARVPVSGPDDLRALSDSFNHMAASLEQNDRERRDMLADIAHELRTPLTVMRGRLEGIVDGVYPSNAEHIVPALEETYLLERLVEDLRLLTLAESRQLHFEKSRVDLNDLARHVVDLFQAEAEDRKIALALEPASAEAAALLDSQRTEQVLGNLVANALRYTPESGSIHVVVEKAEGQVVLAVNDSGPGIPEDDLPRIFNRFWRGEKSRSRASGGAGLGLAIARQLVEAQGGSISARNLPEGGLQVRSEFPTA
jgi:two-component system OmpR family sensor kinase/two-component system sensor histidine kinase BaeS